MAKHYDAALKHLVDVRPLDWLDLAGLPHGSNVKAIDADLSAVTASADRLLLIEGESPYIAHLEFQSGYDSDLDHRVMYYNVLARWRHKVPVRSVVFLLSPKAAGAMIRGRFEETADFGSYVRFEYQLIRAWELPIEAVWRGGVGTLPLALLSAALQDVPAVVAEFERRVRPLPTATAEELSAAAYLLAGLRSDAEVIRKLIRGVLKMEESITYQEILQEGALQGAIKARREDVVRLGTRRFGPIPAEMEKALQAIDEPQRLNRFVDSMFDATSWDDLLKS